MVLRFFGESLSPWVWPVFILYNAIGVGEKGTAIRKTKMIYQLDAKFVYWYAINMVLEVKEGLMVWVEKEYVEKSVTDKHKELMERVRRKEERKGVFEGLNEVKNSKETSLEKITYVEKYVNYQCRILVLVINLFYDFDYVVLGLTSGYVLADIWVKYRLRKLFTEQRRNRIEHQNEIEWLLHSREDAEKEHLEIVYVRQTKIFRKKTLRYLLLDSGLKIAESAVFGVYITGALWYLLTKTGAEQVCKFLSVMHKLEKLSECVIKVF